MGDTALEPKIVSGVTVDDIVSAIGNFGLNDANRGLEVKSVDAHYLGRIRQAMRGIGGMQTFADGNEMPSSLRSALEAKGFRGSVYDCVEWYMDSKSEKIGIIAPWGNGKKYNVALYQVDA